jgi:hypothetical protein
MDSFSDRVIFLSFDMWIIFVLYFFFPFAFVAPFISFAYSVSSWSIIFKTDFIPQSADRPNTA